MNGHVQKNRIAIRTAALRLAALTLAICMTAPFGCDAADTASTAQTPPVTAHPTAIPAVTAAPDLDTQNDADGLSEAESAREAVPIYRVQPIDENVVNVLLIGTDSRAAHGALVGGNADTVILASFDRAENAVTLVSFMRDAYLPIGGPNGTYNKLKAAYRDGGTGLLINTLNSYFLLDVQSYVAVGLEGFAAFVDEALGGLDVTLNAAEIAYINSRITEYENESALVKNCPPVTDPPGRVHLNGTQTLLFVRNRSTAVTGGKREGDDYDRAARQQEILRLMYEQFIAKEPLSAVPGVVRFALGHVETNLTVEEICRLAEPLMTQTIQIESVSVPFAGTWTYGGDGSGILFDRAQTVKMLRARLYPRGRPRDAKK